jgi:hypothetical protein
MWYPGYCSGRKVCILQLSPSLILPIQKMQTLRDFEEKPYVEVYDNDIFFICSAMLINNIYVYNTFVERVYFYLINK